jgi:hypothetical protein
VEWLESVECGFRSTGCTGEEEHVEEERDRGLGRVRGVYGS